MDLPEDEDIFGLRPSLGPARFVEEAEDGTQVWDYPVEENVTYRVWILPSPLRVIERHVFRGQLPQIYINSDFFGITPLVSLPRHILTEDIEILADTITAVPPPLFVSRADWTPFRERAADAATQGDTILLFRIFEALLPRTQNDLTDSESRILADVTEMTFRAFNDEGLVIRALSHDPTNYKIADLAITIRLAVNDETGAVKAAERFMRARDHDRFSTQIVADLLRDLHRLDQLEELFETSVARFPKELSYHLRLGQARMEQKDLIGGEDAYDTLTLLIEDLAPEERAEWSYQIAASLADVNIALSKAKRLIDYALAVDRHNPRYIAVRTSIEQKR